MMNKLVASALAGLTIILPGSIDAAPKWQPAQGLEMEQPRLNSPDDGSGIAIYSSGQSIIIVTDHSVEVRVFTILGQLVSHDWLQAGASMLNINSRGIYIVKIENITQKVAL